MCCLNGISAKYLSKKRGNMYCLFIDFKAAFDNVHDELVWHVLKKQGVKGKVLLTMYSPLKSCVYTNDVLTDFFNCKVGTRQCCMISPMLFVFFINELYEFFLSKRLSRNICR